MALIKSRASCILIAASNSAGKINIAFCTTSLVRHSHRHRHAMALQHREPSPASTFSNRIHRTWQYRHDERGRIIEAIDPSGASLRPGYPEDGMAQPASPSATMTGKPAGMVVHVIDDFGRRVASISSDSGKTRYVHDEADRLIASTDAAGNRAVYAYDISGRILRPYLWPGDQPLAVIHSLPGRASAGDGALVQAKRDGGTALLHFATPHPHKAQSVSF